MIYTTYKCLKCEITFAVEGKLISNGTAIYIPSCPNCRAWDVIIYYVTGEEK